MEFYEDRVLARVPNYRLRYLPLRHLAGLHITGLEIAPNQFHRTLPSMVQECRLKQATSFATPRVVVVMVVVCRLWILVTALPVLNRPRPKTARIYLVF